MNTAIERDAIGDISIQSAYNYHTLEVVVIASTYLPPAIVLLSPLIMISPLGHLTASRCAISCVHRICRNLVLLTYSNRCILTAQLASLGVLSFVEIAPHLLYRKGVNDVDPSKEVRVLNIPQESGTP